PRSREFEELLVLDSDLAPRPVQVRLAEPEADRQLPHPRLGGKVREDAVERAIEVHARERTARVDADLRARRDPARPLDVERLLALWCGERAPFTLILVIRVRFTGRLLRCQKPCRSASVGNVSIRIAIVCPLPVTFRPSAL